MSERTSTSSYGKGVGGTRIPSSSNWVSISGGMRFSGVSSGGTMSSLAGTTGGIMRGGGGCILGHPIRSDTPMGLRDEEKDRVEG